MSYRIYEVMIHIHSYVIVRSKYIQSGLVNLATVGFIKFSRRSRLNKYISGDGNQKPVYRVKMYIANPFRLKLVNKGSCLLFINGQINEVRLYYSTRNISVFRNNVRI